MRYLDYFSSKYFIFFVNIVGSFQVSNLGKEEQIVHEILHYPYSNVEF